jgi:hypothetical protein
MMTLFYVLLALWSASALLMHYFLLRIETHLKAPVPLKLRLTLYGLSPFFITLILLLWGISGDLDGVAAKSAEDIRPHLGDS